MDELQNKVHDIDKAQAVLTTNLNTLTQNVGHIGDSIIEVMKVQAVQTDNLGMLMGALKWTVVAIVGAVIFAVLELVIKGGAKIGHIG